MTPDQKAALDLERQYQREQTVAIFDAIRQDVGDAEFAKMIESAGLLLASGAEMLKIEKKAPASWTAAGFFDDPELSHCPDCNTPFLWEDRAKTASDPYQEQCLATIEKHLPERIRPIYRVVFIHCLVCEV